MNGHPYMIDASSPGPKVCAACGREATEPCDLMRLALELGILGVDAGGPTKAGIYKDLREALDVFEAEP